MARSSNYAYINSGTEHFNSLIYDNAKDFISSYLQKYSTFLFKNI